MVVGSISTSNVASMVMLAGTSTALHAGKVDTTSGGCPVMIERLTVISCGELSAVVDATVIVPK